MMSLGIVGDGLSRCSHSTPILNSTLIPEHIHSKNCSSDLRPGSFSHLASCRASKSWESIFGSTHLPPPETYDLGMEAASDCSTVWKIAAPPQLTLILSLLSLLSALLASSAASWPLLWRPGVTRPVPRGAAALSRSIGTRPSQAAAAPIHSPAAPNRPSSYFFTEPAAGAALPKSTRSSVSLVHDPFWHTSCFIPSLMPCIPLVPSSSQVAHGPLHFFSPTLLVPNPELGREITAMHRERPDRRRWLAGRRSECIIWFAVSRAAVASNSRTVRRRQSARRRG